MFGGWEGVVACLSRTRGSENAAFEWVMNGGGSVRGLRARGGFEVDIAWDDRGRLSEANVTSLEGGGAWVTVGDEPLGTDGFVAGNSSQKTSVEGFGKGKFVLLSPAGAGQSYRVLSA
ncbi:hypothetical protein D0868_09132 [Hortaea werneckii]|uniref:Alpha fucosidase A-like C-terminal domain-containing protein n=1 Tax=Hortaea werneckii TaxID=91943 RepID=A0A3M7AIP0_HORWE|nr:hypothetical protein D0868_09132 [Hortaea werneckii]RMY27337.1 hypothetical protein D0866_10221 [Hortaea werneckii]